MFGTLLGPDIRAAIQNRDFTALKEVFSQWPTPDLAELISGLPENDRVIIFRLLPTQVAADLFEYLPVSDQTDLLKAMGNEEASRLINEMRPDDRTALFEELPAKAVSSLLQLLSPDEFKKTQTLLGYPEESVGRLMTPDFISVPESWTVQQVLDHIRQVGRDSETLNVIYVTDGNGKLLFDVRIREFLLNPVERPVSEIPNKNFVALTSTDDRKQVVQVFRKYDRTVLPAVDSQGKLLGIVTVDDVLDILEKETTEEIQKIGGSEALDEAYTTISMPRMIRKRATWLVLLFLGEMLTATAMGFFESEIARAVVLSLFVPLIISSGGNSGSQSATLVIRALTVGEIGCGDWWKVLRRELMAGLSLGAILGGIGIARITLWSAFSSIYGPHWFLVAMVVGCAILAVVLWGSISGAMLPLLLKRIGVDPATSSAPFVATLVDVTGLVIYFSIAAVILRGILL